MTTESPTDVWRSPRYHWYVVAVCTAAYVLSFVDRQILSLMIEPIKRDLHLTDTQFSLLNGLAFSLFYSIMGLPIARLADRRSRPLIIAIGMAFWSLATALSGLAKGFAHLFAARIGVGVGEAALSPAAYSMFSDMFPKEKLGRAYGIYSLGSYIGGAAAFVIGGYVIHLLSSVDSVVLPVIGEMRAWQLTFLIVGLPGLVLALLVAVTVRDPGRRGLQYRADGTVERVAFRTVLEFLGQHRATFTTLYLGFSCYALVLLGLLAWTPAFFMRAYGLTPTATGYLLGAVVLLANGTGVLFGGWLIDALARRGRTDAGMRVGMLGALGTVVPVVAFPHVGPLWLAVVLLAVAMFCASFAMPASTAAMQVLSPNQVRAQVAALFLLISNLIAVALGTTLIGLVTDHVFHDEKAVGSSMSLVYGVASVLAVVILRRGCRYFRTSMATAHPRSAGEEAQEMGAMT